MDLGNGEHMGILQRIFGRKRAPEAEHGADTFVIPDDGKLVFYSCNVPVPAARRMPNGAVLVSLGLDTDDAGYSVRTACEALDGELTTAASVARITAAPSLKQAFYEYKDEPEQPVVFWAVQPSVFAHAPAMVEAFADLVIRLRTGLLQETSQIVFVLDDAEQRAKVVADALLTFGIATRRTEEDQNVLAEIHRNKDDVVVAVLGTPHGQRSADLGWLDELCAAIAAGEEGDKVAQLRARLLESARFALAPNITNAPYLAQIAPAMYSALQEARESDEGLELVCAALARRTSGIGFVAKNVEQRSVACIESEQGPFFAAYVDAMTVKACFGDDNVPLFVMSTMEAVRWLLSLNVGLGLALPGSEQPQYAIIPAADLARVLEF